jgi:ABC-2 type transport system permease protein
MSPSLRTQLVQLTRRSLMRTLRQPAQIVPALVFPLFLLALNTGGLDETTKIPGFPTDSYLTFALGFTFTQGAILALMNAGMDFANDVETGFLNRLALTPLRATALLAGMLAGVVALGLLQAGVYLLVGLLAGADFAAGIAGAGVIVALSLLVTLGFGAVGAAAALRTGSGEAVQGLFPLMFVFLFMSSMALPRNLIENDWFREVATYNPVSYLIEAARSLLVEGWDTEALALGFGVAGVLVVGGLALASATLRTRMTRT